jgi:hypothetical protein
VPEEFFAQWSGVHSMRVLLCGNPAAPPYQMVLTGNHINLRLGGRSSEGAAFGGPQVYGDQRGNERPGLPGNLYRDQYLLAQRIFQNLEPAAKRIALLESEPVQTGIELQGPSGTFPGVSVSSLDAENQAFTRELVDDIFATYPADDVAYARECLRANGGIENLFLSYYQRGSDGDVPAGQVFCSRGRLQCSTSAAILTCTRS